MSYRVKFIPKFEKELKRLAKKYPSLKADFSLLLATLKENPTQGTALGNECYKVRMSIASKGKGKSGGARVITCFKVVQSTVYLLTLFDKSEKENIPDKELKELLKFIDE
ncbi:type II toxin-antitoxin system RelE/ParE family toxin [Mucilaginibacter sp. OK283]|jgi:mRNA-degrading endonuclease RelE of RelBE toxin-antitoxin system|uniref:type II toxin-antitoxin system RelE/ParE family toxin n=1 Tax=Mucilaginibacter sp. OK283 TaxID=1881049 RepID=UPI0008BDEFA7|nr:type II toxin-antitoxin system RelE/ParE family toxin [Mucilaginibacter sp. OK283]SEO43390.1 mRNA-degrading endonuclease RelE, toxin component of the RelBE toxin-antitoxin system [Mucilaginibacter sp. OK283]